jgi:uncharacterized membrane protein YedE/YeeE
VSAWLRAAVLLVGSLLLENSIFPSKDMPLPSPARGRNFWTECLLNVMLFAVAVAVAGLLLLLARFDLIPGGR